MDKTFCSEIQALAHGIAVKVADYYGKDLSDPVVARQRQDLLKALKAIRMVAGMSAVWCASSHVDKKAVGLWEGACITHDEYRALVAGW